jgi:hypothetical protein
LEHYANEIQSRSTRIFQQRYAPLTAANAAQTTAASSSPAALQLRSSVFCKEARASAAQAGGCMRTGRYSTLPSESHNHHGRASLFLIVKQYLKAVTDHNLLVMLLALARFATAVKSTTLQLALNRPLLVDLPKITNN